MSTGRLAGKVAIITGASTGTGEVMAQQFVNHGGKVVITARREDVIQSVAAKIGENALGVRCDVTSEDDVKSLVAQTMDKFGQIDVLVNNAVIPGKDLYVWEQTLENWHAVLDVTLTANMLTCREVMNASMLERRTGSIINVSSTAGWMGMVRKTHYVTGKAGMRAFTKTVALEGGPYNIRCNCLVPGGIDTDLWRNWGKRMAEEQGITFEEWKENSLSSVPLRTISTPEDISNLALFLASEESRTITGQSITCDAGSYMVG